ncbi:MAG: hypothetical protein GYB67_11570 [Chloroflexi bacterium]|nr:hypothetical protein [Chloroflexota bacterium]
MNDQPRAALLAIFGLIVVLLIAAAPALAQEQVTLDDVNEVAEKLYCPVCENIPLVDCYTAACIRWRDEIRVQLQDGISEDAIIADFVRRFGERAVGTPRDPFLNAFSVVTPYVLALVVLSIAGLTFARWWRGRPAHAPSTAAATPDAASVDGAAPPSADDTYRSRLERDLLS